MAKTQSEKMIVSREVAGATSHGITLGAARELSRKNARSDLSKARGGSWHEPAKQAPSLYIDNKPERAFGQ